MLELLATMKSLYTHIKKDNEYKVKRIYSNVVTTGYQQAIKTTSLWSV